MSSFAKRFVVMNIMHSTKFVKWEFDSQAGWRGVEVRIKRMELRRRHLKLLRYVALFIAPVLILVFALQDISVPHVMDDNQFLLYLF